MLSSYGLLSEIKRYPSHRSFVSSADQTHISSAACRTRKEGSLLNATWSLPTLIRAQIDQRIGPDTLWTYSFKNRWHGYVA